VYKTIYHEQSDVGKIIVKCASGCEPPGRPPRLQGVDTAQVSAVIGSFIGVAPGGTLSATQPEGLPEQPTTGTPPESFPVPAEHQWPRTGVAQFHSARGIPSISPLGTLSILMRACNEEAAGTHLLPFGADLEYDAEKIPPDP
jgi:hypothetical protein